VWLAAGLGALFLAAVTPALARGAIEPTPASRACPNDTRLGPRHDACFPVRDARGVRSDATARRLPNLGELRRQRRSRRRLEPIGAPVPGGIGIGTTYLSGQLTALSEAELEITVFVQPDGIEPTNQNLEWLFSTATNRSDRGVEVVAWYHFDGPGALGIFDWSCSAAWPCAGGKTTPSWIWSYLLSSLPDNLFQVFDDGGHLQTALRYVNRTQRLDTATPPLWRNSVLLWNERNQGWDLHYEHTYRAEQRDCSAGNACGWWGPILEDFRVDVSQPYPEIRELGFQDTQLLHDGALSQLGPDETSFLPPITPWILAHHEPNAAYGAGNVFGDDPACDDGVDNDQDGLVDFAGGDSGCDDALDASEQADTLPCDDGIDNDGDGWADFSGGDPGCESLASDREDPECQDGADNDGQAGTDFDGGVSVLGFGNGDPAGADPQCNEPWTHLEAAPPSCGLGVELVLSLPLLLAARRRRSSP